MWMSSNYLKFIVYFQVLLLLASPVMAQDLKLDDLVGEALKNSPEIRAFQSRIEAAKQRIPQAKSLPDPQLTFGYQNEGFDRYSYGEEQGSQWMFGASQQFLFPGKRALKGEMAARDAESQEAMYELLKLKTVSRVTELYYDLFLAHKNIDLLKNREVIFIRIEDQALARYSTGKAMQQEVLMAQTEKYMLLEKEAMFRQKIQSLEALLRAAVGRQGGAPLGRPPENLPYRLFLHDADTAVQTALQHSPEIKSRNKMIDAADARVMLAKKDYFPDFSVNAGYFNRTGIYKDMWGLASTINIPIYFKTKQEPAVLEAKAALLQARQELEATKLMIDAAVRDNLSMVKSADKLMDLYKNGLIPRNAQDVESALSGYASGKTEAIVILSRVKALLEYENQYWVQFTEREKAMARLHAITQGLEETSGGAKK